MKRRSFIKTTSGLAAASLVSTLARPLMAISPNSKYKDTIGLQLWTVRDQMAESKQNTLKAIANAGYKQVELGDTATTADILPICRDLGMNVTSSFLNWQAICTPGDKQVPTLDSILDDAVSADLKYLVFGYISKEHRQTADQLKRYAESANKFGEKCNQAGIKLCYHNHSFEFAKIEGEKTGFELFMDLFDNDLCKFELDVFWAKIGGWDPVETLKKLNGRVLQVHLKDLKQGTKLCYDEGKVPHDAFQELGNGTIDMLEIMNVSEAIGVDQCHVEQDQSPDPIASIVQSMTHLNNL